MLIAFSNTVFSVDVPLRVGSVEHPADGVGSWALLDATMQPVAGLIDQPLTFTPGALRASITIPASGNLKSGEVASRFIRVTWQSSGVQRQTSLGYLIIDWAPVMTTPEDARRFLGASKAEVPDADFDIWRAWLELRSQLGSAEALSRLASNDDSSRRMNEAIACRAAANVAQFITLRLASRMSSETLSFQRFADIDINALVRDLIALENRLLFPETAEVNAAPSTFFQLSTVSSDVVTGA